VLYVHPFAEEMNKSRRMAALQARAFAASGWDVLLMDLHGCGDSSGDFGDATWSLWQDDVEAGLRWLAARNDGPVWIWGLRVGALLAATVAARTSHAHPLLLWQPTVSGHRFIQQFFRSRVISDALADGGHRSTTAGLMSALAAGTVVEVAGYQLSPDLILPLERSEMPSLPSGSIARWVEIADADDGGVKPATRAAIAAWQTSGVDATCSVVVGPQFWQTQDICECIPLIQASVWLISG
jgi:exosortase A-associated hydrolase 2